MITPTSARSLKAFVCVIVYLLQYAVFDCIFAIRDMATRNTASGSASSTQKDAEVLESVTKDTHSVSKRCLPSH